MNILFLVVALAVHAEAPRAEIHEVAAASAAVASVQAVPEVVRCSPVTAHAPTFREVSSCAAAKPGNCSLRAADSAAPIRLVEFYTRQRVLSGPWIAARRLEAARRRGDAEEARRMETRLNEFVSEALSVEE